MSSTALSSLGQAWTAVDAGLAAAAHLWRDEPFRHAASAGDWLGPLEEELVDGACLQSVIPGLDTLLRAADELEPAECTLPPLPLPRNTGRRDVGVPGRKWAQAEAFASLLPPSEGPLIDWCSGKGHLARSLHQRGCCGAAHCLEIDPALCDAGATLSRRRGLPIDFSTVDVLAAPNPLPERLRGAAFAHSALHACGELHRRALRTACAERAHLLAVVPCCYHKFGPEQLEPLSRHVATTSKLLPLSRATLQLATAGRVTARARDVTQRAREQSWRLAIDTWQREQRGLDEYLPAPSAAARLSAGNGSFRAFCEHYATAAGASAAERAAVARPLRRMAADAAASRHYLARGEAARLRVERLEVVRRCYSRPLELWLVADLALGLEEAGYDVEVRRLCTRHVTPRNLMVLGRRPYSASSSGRGGAGRADVQS